MPDTVTLVDGLPYHNDQVYVPENPALKHQILRLYHNSLIAGHLRQGGTLELVKRTYWWKGMTTYVREYVQGCHTCSQSKHQNWKEAGLMQPLPTPNGPWQWTQSDHITRLPMSQGYDAIYVIMDHLTKMSHSPQAPMHQQMTLYSSTSNMCGSTTAPVIEWRFRTYLPQRSYLLYASMCRLVSDIYC